MKSRSVSQGSEEANGDTLMDGHSSRLKDLVRRLEADAERDAWRRRKNQLEIWLARLALLALLLGGWEFAVNRGWVDALFTSKPSAIFQALADHWIDYLQPLSVTMYEAIVGFGVGSAFGIAVAVVVAENFTVDRITRPFLTAFNALPRIAFTPLFVLWFGFGPLSKIVLVFTLVFFIVLASSVAGLKSAARDSLLLAKVLGVNRWQRLWYFRLPGAVPSLFAGLQLGIVYSFLGAIVAEMMGGSGGLGGQLQIAITNYRTDEFFAQVVLLLIVTLLISAILQVVESRILRWRAIELRGAGSGIP